MLEGGGRVCAGGAQRLQIDNFEFPGGDARARARARDETWMIIWQQYEKMSQCSTISGYVPATWAAGESPEMNASVCKHTETMSRTGFMRRCSRASMHKY